MVLNIETLLYFTHRGLIGKEREQTEMKLWLSSYEGNEGGNDLRRVLLTPCAERTRRHVHLVFLDGTSRTSPPGDTYSLMSNVTDGWDRREKETTRGRPGDFDLNVSPFLLLCTRGEGSHLEPPERDLDTVGPDSVHQLIYKESPQSSVIPEKSNKS